MYPDYTRHIERLPRFIPHVAGHWPNRLGYTYGWAMGVDYWIVFNYKTGEIVWRERAWIGSTPGKVAERLNR